jgi:thioredoxin 1
MNTKKVVEGTDFNFEQEVLQSNTPVLVDFWAPWCGPCRMVAPMVEEIAEEYQGKIKVVKLNTDDNQNTAMQFGIRSIPTLGIFKDGQIVDAVIGAVPKRHLEEKIKPHLVSIN